MDRDEADTCLLPNSLWTDVAAMNSHADATIKVVTQVRMGSISMTLIDSEGQANKVPRKPARAPPSGCASPSPPDGASPSRGAIPPDQKDDNASIILYLAGTIVNLAERATVLEAKLKEVTTASASQPKGDTIVASPATGTWCKKRRSDEEYRVPRWTPWALDSGWWEIANIIGHQRILKTTSWSVVQFGKL